MRRMLVAIASVATLLSASCAANRATSGTPGGAASPDRNAAAAVAARHLRVIATNDFHGHLLPEPQSFAGGARVGGAAEFAAYVARERAAFTQGPTILLDAGDVMQGTPLSNLVYGRSSVDFFNAIGYSAVAIGNHEFDWSQDTLRARIAQAHYPWLAANIVVAGTDTAPSWVKPTAVITVNGMRVGIVGLITEDTPQSTQLKNIVGLAFTDGAAALDRWVSALRRQKVDFVIVVAHSGGSCDKTNTTCHGEIVDWATRTRAKPDLIVAAHSHTQMQTFANGIPIVQAGSYGNRYNVVDLTRVTRDSVSAVIAPMRVVYADSVTPVAAIAAMVAHYRTVIGPDVDRVIGTATADVTRGGGESPMGRLIADAQRYAAHSQIAIMNSGGIRAPIAAGPITWGNLFQVHPFANRLVLLKLSGANLRGAIEHGVAGRDVQSQVSGLRGVYDTSRTDGSRLLSLTLDDGTPIRDDAFYTVVVNDFLATGAGDGFTNLGMAVEKTDIGVVDLEALIEYVKHLGTVSPPLEPRLRPVGQQ